MGQKSFGIRLAWGSLILNSWEFFIQFFPRIAFVFGYCFRGKRFRWNVKRGMNCNRIIVYDITLHIFYQCLPHILWIIPALERVRMNSAHNNVRQFIVGVDRRREKLLRSFLFKWQLPIIKKLIKDHANSIGIHSHIKR